MYLSIDDEVSVSAVHHWFDSADSTLILEGEEIEKLEDLKYLTGLKNWFLKKYQCCRFNTIAKYEEIIYFRNLCWKNKQY